MKFTQEHYNSLKTTIELIYPSSVFDRGTKSETRYLWDIYWASKWSTNHRDWVDLYLDSHIQTALKKIVAEILATRKCSECGRVMSEDEHNYGTSEEAGNIQTCIQCYNDAQFIASEDRAEFFKIVHKAMHKSI